MTHRLIAAAPLLLATTALAQPTQDAPQAPCTELWPEDAGRDAFILQTWPGGVVPYAFDENVSPQRRTFALSAMEVVMDECAVRFVPRSDEDDYVVIRSSTGNSSWVGRIGGPQTINIASWSHRYIIVHEYLHALGDNHEQARPDRDAYVQIHHENIETGHEHNFEVRNAAVAEGPYDFESVMHYPHSAFSANGQSTITVRPPFEQFQNVIGQRDRLSEGDILGLAARYGEPPRADFSGDNLVNSADLGVLLEAWGTDAVDADGDGVAGVRDLGILLAEWDG